MRTFVTLCGVLCTALGLSAWAADAPQEPLPGYCLSERTANISVQMTAKGPDALDLKKKFKDGVAAAQSFSSGLGITKMHAGGMHYTIQPIATGGGAYNGVSCLDCIRRSAAAQGQAEGGFQLYGNVNFQLEPASKALSLANHLQEKGMIASVNYVDITAFKDRCTLDVSSGKWQ